MLLPAVKIASAARAAPGRLKNDDYCGTGLALFDRCEPCQLLWIDADVLGTMTLMWARMEARYNRSHAENEAALRDAQMLVDCVMLGRHVAALLRGNYGGFFDPNDPYDPFNPL